MNKRGLIRLFPGSPTGVALAFDRGRELYPQKYSLKLPYLFRGPRFWNLITPRITGCKKRCDDEEPLFAVRVHAIVMHLLFIEVIGIQFLDLILTNGGYPDIVFSHKT